MNRKQHLTRRQVIQQSAAAGAVMALSGCGPALAAVSVPRPGSKTKSRGYAAFDPTGELKPWEFERRPVGDHDVLISIKYASICHSDIHQLKGDWGPQTYPQIPGHEMVGIVAAVGRKVTKFKVGDRAGVGCMVDSCLECDSCKRGEEQYCERGETLFTYGYPDNRSPTGITQGGYSTSIVVRDHFAVHIPDNIPLQEAAPLLCAGITTYSPLMQANFDKGDRIGVAGIGGLGHLAVKLAVSKGAEVYAFTTSPDKTRDILEFGAKEAIVVDDLKKLASYKGRLDYLINTIPVQYAVAAYASVVKPRGYYTQVGMADGFSLKINTLGLSLSRVNFNVSLIGGIPETQEVIQYCADANVRPKIQVIKASEISDAWVKVVSKRARYRYVIDAATF